MGEWKIVSCVINECYIYDTWGHDAFLSYLTDITNELIIDWFIFIFIFQDVNPSLASPSYFQFHLPMNLLFLWFHLVIIRFALLICSYVSSTFSVCWFALVIWVPFFSLAGRWPWWSICLVFGLTFIMRDHQL
jgi:hypothetical protein